MRKQLKTEIAYGKRMVVTDIDELDIVEDRLNAKWHYYPSWPRKLRRKMNQNLIEIKQDTKKMFQRKIINT